MLNTHFLLKYMKLWEIPVKHFCETQTVKNVNSSASSYIYMYSSNEIYIRSFRSKCRRRCVEKSIALVIHIVIEEIQYKICFRLKTVKLKEEEDCTNINYKLILFWKMSLRRRITIKVKIKKKYIIFCFDCFPFLDK